MTISKPVTKDPICGMTVDEATAIHAERDGKTFYFCSEHCRQKLARTMKHTKQDTSVGSNFNDRSVKAIATPAKSVLSDASVESALGDMHGRGVDSSFVVDQTGALLGSVSKDKMDRNVGGFGPDPKTEQVESQLEKSAATCFDDQSRGFPPTVHAMKALLTFALLLVSTFCVRAAVIFDRPPDGSGVLIPSSWYAPDGLDSDVYAYENFTVANDTWLTEIVWQGGGGSNLDFWITIFDPAHPVGNPQVNSTWVANFYSTGNPNQTPVGTVGGTVMYSFKYILPTPVRLYAGTPYRLMVEDNSGTWAGIARGGSGVHLTFFTGSARFEYRAGNTAFTLISTDTIYTITATASPANAGTITGTGIFPVGMNASITATPNTGYRFVEWTENGVRVTADPTYNFTLTTNRSFVAVFASAVTTAVSVSPASGGTVTGAGAFPAGTNVTLTAIPAPGYDFLNWTENGTGVGTATTLSFTATTNRSLVANFGIAPQAAFIDFDTSTPHYGLFFLSNSSEWAQSNRGVTAYFLPSVNDWVANDFILGRGSWEPSVFSGMHLSPPYLFYGGGGGTLQIRFSELVTSVAFSFVSFDLRNVVDLPTAIRVTAYNNAPPPVGSITKAGAWIDITQYPEGIIVFNSATPFDRVVVDIPLGQQLNQAIKFAVDNVVIRRAGAPNWFIAATASPAPGGTVTGAGGYFTDNLVTLTGWPSAGYRFADWTESGTIVSSDAIYLFTATASRTLVANFMPMIAVIKATPGTLVFSWPTSATGWVLQESPDLSSGSWTTSTRTVTVVNGQSQVTVPTSEGSRFFRLLHQ